MSVRTSSRNGLVDEILAHVAPAQLDCAVSVSVSVPVSVSVSVSGLAPSHRGVSGGGRPAAVASGSGGAQFGGVRLTKAVQFPGHAGFPGVPGVG